MPPDSPFAAGIRCLACQGIVSGYSDGTFRPYAAVTRGQAAKLVAGAARFGEPIPADRQTFADVPAGQPFWLFVERLAGHGVVGGYGCGGLGEPCDPQRRPYFRPAADVRRGQFAQMVARAAGYPEDPPGQTFADVPPAHPFYRPVQQVASRGIISGYTCGGPGEPCDPQGRPYFRPYNTATRGQAAKIASGAFFPACAP